MGKLLPVAIAMVVLLMTSAAEAQRRGGQGMGQGGMGQGSHRACPRGGYNRCHDRCLMRLGGSDGKDLRVCARRCSARCPNS
jgi:hypothetical protein